VAAGMKRRKVADSDDEKDQEDTGIKTARPFIGPQLPSPPPSATTQPISSITDPQAEIVKKKIEAASSKAKAAQALRDLSLYADNDDSSKEDDRSSNHVPSSLPPTSSPATPSSIPPSSFYGNVEQGQKRKTSNEDAEENEYSRSDRIRKPLYNSPSLTSSSPHFKHRKKISFGSGNPFSRVRGGNNLHQKDSASYRPPLVTYKKRRTYAI